ncbi:MAG: hypothetical protein IT181_07140 [Acidobacteria bacterium]|nr:hypothetical protein [Acidobacteriota bacterium]
MSVVLAVAFSGALLSPPQPDAATQTLLKAAVALRTFDHFARACIRDTGFDDAGLRTIEAWRISQQVERVRVRVEEAERTPGIKQAIDSAVRSVAGRLQGQALTDCALAVSVTKTTEAQFVTTAPSLTAGTEAPSRGGPPAAPPVSAPPPPAAPAPSATPGAASSTVDAAVLAAIDSFGFNMRPAMGIGGFITTDIYPIVLFKNGEVLDDVEGLRFAGGIAAHKRAHPDEWSRWQRAGGELQILEKKGWEKLPFQNTYAALPDGFRLDGLFRRLSGTGNMGVGGTDAVTAWNEFRFSPDGRVIRGGGAGSRSEFGTTSTATSSVAPNRRGAYRIDGLLLRITYDDGSTEQHILITDPKDPKGAIWLDGEGYVQRR